MRNGTFSIALHGYGMKIQTRAEMRSSKILYGGYLWSRGGGAVWKEGQQGLHPHW
jgi:hypothetical protein